MIEIFFSFLMVPVVLMDHNPSSFYVAVQQELYKKHRVGLLRRDGKVIYKEEEGGIDTKLVYGSDDRLSKISEQTTEGFVRVLPLEFARSESVPLPMITENNATAFFFQNKNKQIVAVARAFQLSNQTILNQDVSRSNYWGYINILILKMFGVQQQPELLPEEPKQKFVQVTKGCALAVSDDCLIARSGAGDEFEEL